MVISDFAPPSRARFLTGIPGLDQVLGGGFLTGAVYLIQGSPGAGKTIIGNQIAFNCVQRGERVLYLSMIGESHGRMLANLSNLSFYDPAAYGTSITLFSAFNTLADEGVDGLLRLAATEARRHQVSLVVLDGLFVVEEVFDSDRDFRKFINALTHQAELLQCTMLLLTNSRRSSSSPEYAMVDGWVELTRARMARRSIRQVEVLKLRGSNFVSGLHCMDITEDGMEVFPRLDAVEGRHPERGVRQGRLDTGVSGLDKILHGGLPVASTTLLMGSPGSGKTSLGLQFLTGCSPEHPGLLFGFYETVERLAAKARHLCMDLDALIKSGAVRVVWHPPMENLIDQLGRDLLDHVREHSIQRVVVDGIGPFSHAAGDDAHTGSFLAALSNALRERACTALLIAESPTLAGYSEVTFTNVSAVAENIIVLRYQGEETAEDRTLRVLKMRESLFDAAAYEFLLTSEGLALGAAYEHAGPRNPSAES